jgi:small subunit ribosomal protein S6
VFLTLPVSIFNKGHIRMLRYETLLLAVPEITKDETAALEKQIDQLIKKAKGSMISFERWGKYRLAYPVRKNDYGVYFLARFDVENDQGAELLHDLNALFSFKKADLIMRSMMTNLKPDLSLSYQKPESLEDSPSRDVDSFLRENKMEGLIKSSNNETKRTEPLLEEEDMIHDEEILDQDEE